VTADRRYLTPAAFRSAADAKIRATARQVGRPFGELRREFLYQRFLARVFARDPGLWVLKGGVGILARFPGARHSRDIDLVHLDADPASAEVELREIGRLDLGDHLRFEITRSVLLSVPDALRLKTAAYTGVTVWDNFDIDISCERHFVAEVQAVQPEPVLDIVGMTALPVFRLYPLTDQIADKVAAMYEKHGGMGAPSNRYRDLADLILLISVEEIDAALLIAALRSREQHARNPVALPAAMQAPGPGWSEGYPLEAKRSPLTAHLNRLDDALAHVGTCLNPILAGTVTSGRWNPAAQRWET
jgi:nucleotidyltransferase AbiEii toxin of type IV toxin-antitoxin system